MEIGLCHVCYKWSDAKDMTRVTLVESIIGVQVHLCKRCADTLKAGKGILDIKIKTDLRIANSRVVKNIEEALNALAVTIKQASERKK